MNHSVLLKNIKKNSLTPILSLHRVTNDHLPFWPAITPQNFKVLLTMLMKDFSIITFAEKQLQSKKPTLILSFDDGYYDFFENVVPLLKKFNIKANHNLIASCVQSGQAPWSTQIYDYLNSLNDNNLGKLNIKGFENHFHGNKTIFGIKLSKFLKNKQLSERTQLIQDLLEKAQSLCPQKKSKMMSVSDIKQIKDYVEFGSHSFSHESMNNENMQYFVDDFDKCKSFFSNQLNLPMKIYAFPNGSHRQEHLTFLEQQGISHTLLVDDKLSRSRDSKVYSRLNIYGESSNEIYIRSLGYFAS